MSVTLSSPLYIEMYNDAHSRLSRVLLLKLEYCEPKYYNLNIRISLNDGDRFITNFKYNTEIPNFDFQNIKSFNIYGVEIFIESITTDFINKIIVVKSVPESIITSTKY